MRNHSLESRVRENRTHGSEEGERHVPLSVSEGNGRLDPGVCRGDEFTLLRASSISTEIRANAADGLLESLDARRVGDAQM